MSLTIDSVNSLENPYQSAPPLGLQGFSSLNQNPASTNTQPTYYSATVDFPYLQEATHQQPLNATLNPVNQPQSSYFPNAVTEFKSTTSLNTSLNTPLNPSLNANLQTANQPNNLSVNPNQAGGIVSNQTAPVGNTANTNNFNATLPATITNPNPALATAATTAVANQSLAAQTINNSQTQSELQNFGTNGGILNGFATPTAYALTQYATDPYATSSDVPPVAGVPSLNNPTINTSA